jgi:hypothetical protein
VRKIASIILYIGYWMKLGKMQGFRMAEIAMLLYEVQKNIESLPTMSLRNHELHGLHDMTAKIVAFCEGKMFTKLAPRRKLKNMDSNGT